MTQHPYPPQPPYWQPQPPRRGWSTKRKIWTSVGVAFAAVSVIAHATNVKNAHQAETAVAKPAPSHSTIAPRATPSAKPKPKTAPVDYSQASKRLANDVLSDYCSVIFSPSRKGTLGLNAFLVAKGRTGTITVSVEGSRGYSWSDGLDVVDEATFDRAIANLTGPNPPSSPTPLVQHRHLPVKLVDVRSISASLIEDSDQGETPRQCAVYTS